ncbi:hypothetical protein JCM19047_4100 [Bacillus sp. JCM 19047]|uniref:hypothetical protein n=1 Tax=Shouchella miscanthi TaxID=2598861 RepID=UPI0003F00A29|nr:hypothetical protein [Shouchella miscanthi]GAF24223.1 hypothetical protein JCM19047_4100 [Bacillus sp. JCM 19047]
MTIEINGLLLVVIMAVFFLFLFMVVEKAVQRGVDASKLKEDVEKIANENRKE